MDFCSLLSEFPSSYPHSICIVSLYDWSFSYNCPPVPFRPPPSCGIFNVMYFFLICIRMNAKSSVSSFCFRKPYSNSSDIFFMVYFNSLISMLLSHLNSYKAFWLFPLLIPVHVWDVSCIPARSPIWSAVAVLGSVSGGRFLPFPKCFHLFPPSPRSHGICSLHRYLHYSISQRKNIYLSELLLLILAIYNNMADDLQDI